MKPQKIKLIINKKEIETLPGKTILQVALKNDIHIPHLCNDNRLSKTDGNCGLCTVELENEGGFIQACEIQVKEGMVIQTANPKLESFRRVRLEQLLRNHHADCIAPCVQTCPAHIDIQSYLRQMVNGNIRATLRIIKDRNPFPVVCGRVCPHTCEAECRRSLVDSPVGINYVKRFVAELDAHHEEPYSPVKKPATGKRVAIVGAGPAGLSAAYYSAVYGHDVTVFERQPEAGGMMRYGIPEYRLPKKLLDKEIDAIKKLGVKIQTKKSLGTHIRLEDLQQDFDAAFLAVGAWLPNPLKLEGDRARGVWLGITFLERMTKGIEVELGDTVLVIGGGNTAIDCARTAIRRKDVKKVHLIYRRTKEEMPAEPHEVEDALAEGIEMSFLMAPVDIDFDRDSRYLKGVKFIKMELGPPDRSGRRRPVPVEGDEVYIKATSIIGAIGQSTDTSFLWNDLPVSKNKWGDVEINGKTMETSVEKVFAGGDCVTGPATVIQAVAAGKQAADCMHDFITKGYVPERKDDYACSRGTLEDLPRYEFEVLPKLERSKMPVLPISKRKHNFNETELGLSHDQAAYEAKRCLQCGCSARNDCDLRQEATNYQVKHKPSLKELSYIPIVKDHPFIIRDHNKCISCELCVTICKDFVGPEALSPYLKNGRVLIGTRTGAPLEKTDCVSCGHCVTACPCGALEYKRESDSVFQALNDPKKIVIGFVAPAVRTVIASKYNLKAEESMPFLAGILKSKRLGFDKIFDFTFAADLTIMEETTEFLARVEKGGPLPHLTSCCPGWVNFVERRYPEFIPNLSSCKSPQQMMGATIKNHYIKWAKLEDRASDVFVVSIVPCLAKKYEAARPEFAPNGIRDVDAVLTTTELFEMMDRTKVHIDDITPGTYDEPYSHVSGAGIIFGVSGGVAEASLRMAVEKLSGKPLDQIDFEAVRGLEGIKEAELTVNKKTIRVAVISGLKNAIPILEQLKRKTACKYDLIEVMTCPGGCIDGAGHPRPKDSRELTKRKNIIRALDTHSAIRKSQENPDVIKLYNEYFKTPNSKLSHTLLHTHYQSRKTEDMAYLHKREDSVHPIHTINVCVDKHCFQKGAQQVLEKLRAQVKAMKYDQYIHVEPQLCQGHCKDQDVFVSHNKKRITKKQLDNLDKFIKNEILSKIEPQASES